MSFNFAWEKGYARGHAQRYPWDCVVSFVYKYAPGDIPRNEIEILEVGCGTGSNLWFAAREGFSVAGIDGSWSAIGYARRRFWKEDLEGDFRVGDFTTSLPFQDEAFHLAIDRGALTSCSLSEGKKAIDEIKRVLKVGGRFLFNPYRSTMEPSTLFFYSLNDVYRVLEGWHILSFQDIRTIEQVRPGRPFRAFWLIVAEKTP